MKKIIQWLLVLMPVVSFANNEDGTGSIKGSVTTNDNKKAADVTVVIKNTSKGAITDDNGDFEFSKLKVGTYTLQISLTGYETMEQNITVEENKTASLSFQLKLSDRQLQEVIIITGKNKFAKKESDYIARMPLKNLENPQSYSVVTKQLIQEQSITDYASAIRAIPGLANATQDPYQFSGVYMRGFLTNSYLRNGLYAYSISGGDPQSLERIEAIKGPSGTLFGTSAISYGGLLNKVTKRPFDKTAAEAGLSFGTYNLTRLTADVNTPLNDDHTALFRINAAVNREGSFQDVGFNNSFSLAPVLSYKINDRLDIILEAEINSTNQLGNMYLSGASALTTKSIKDIKLDYFNSYSSADLTHKPTLQNYYAAQVNYKISENWKLNANATLADINSYGSNIFPSFINDSMFSRELYDWNFEWHNTDLQANVNGNFKIGTLRNKLLAGIDYQRFQLFPVTGAGKLNIDTVNLNQPAATPILDVNKMRNSYDYTFIFKDVSNTYAAYVSDVINFTEKLNLMLSLRYDYYVYGGGYYGSQPAALTGQFKQGAFSPKIGATYQLVKNRLTAFANYMNGFQNVAPNAQANQTFTPEQANQVEAGLKAELFGGKLSSTISYYDISVQNKVRTDPNNPTFSIQDGTQQSRGFDIDIITNPLPGLNIVAGYGYNQSKFTKSDKGVEGNRPLGVPSNVGNIWASYAIPQGSAKGLGAGFGLNYNGDVYFDDVNQLNIPAYTLLKTTVFYNQPKFRLFVTLDNITNARYWNYKGTPQMPRRLLAGLSIKI